MSVIPPLGKLYLRQFFTNYFLSQQRKEQLHAFTSGLEVLEEKLATFQQKQLSYVDKMASKDNSGLPMPSVVVPPQEIEEGCGLNVRFQNIFDRIRSLMQIEEIILERLVYEARRTETTAKQTSRIEVIPENELYELISEFRQRNKDLQSKNEQLRNQLQELTKELTGIKDQLVSAAQTKVNLKNQANRQEEKIIDLEKRLGEKDVQINTLLASKVQLMQEIQGKEKDIVELQDSLAEKVAEVAKLKETAVSEAQKISKFNELVEMRISELRREMIAEIKNTISNKENHNKVALGLIKSIFSSEPRPEKFV